MPRRKASRMFRVIVVAGVSLAACGDEDRVISNPPPPNPTDAGADAFADAGSDAAADAPSTDANAADAADAMPIIR